MAASHDEINVFKIPHSRMMQLVNACNNKVMLLLKNEKRNKKDERKLIDWLI